MTYGRSSGDLLCVIILFCSLFRIPKEWSHVARFVVALWQCIVRQSIFGHNIQLHQVEIGQLSYHVLTVVVFNSCITPQIISIFVCSYIRNWIFLVQVPSLSRGVLASGQRSSSHLFIARSTIIECYILNHAFLTFKPFLVELLHIFPFSLPVLASLPLKDQIVAWMV